MVPVGKKSPGVWVLVNVTPIQLSVAPGAVQFTLVPQDEELADTIMLEGQPVITGGVVSID